MWNYKGLPVESIEDFPEGTYGFIYEVTHTPSGKKYIGKKVLYFNRTKKLTKKETELLREERKAKGIGGRVPTKKKVTKESDWKTYYGSNKEIQGMIKEGKSSEFTREILFFVPSKKLLTYYETKLLFKYEVLENENYFNRDILGKFHINDFE